MLGLEDTGARMGRLGGLLSTTGSVRSVDEQIARWRAVDAGRRGSHRADVLGDPRSTAPSAPPADGRLPGSTAATVA